LNLFEAPHNVTPAGNENVTEKCLSTTRYIIYTRDDGMPHINRWNRSARYTPIYLFN